MDANGQPPKVVFRSYAELGRAFARYGMNTTQSADTLIKAATREQEIKWLACAELEKLDDIRDLLRGIQVLLSCFSRDFDEFAEEGPDPIADGRLRSIRDRLGDRTIADCPRQGLSARAKKAINKMIGEGAITLADLTEDGLMVLKNCGEYTTREVLAWADRQRKA